MGKRESVCVRKRETDREKEREREREKERERERIQAVPLYSALYYFLPLYFERKYAMDLIL